MPPELHRNISYHIILILHDNMSYDIYNNYLIYDEILLFPHMCKKIINQNYEDLF